MDMGRRLVAELVGTFWLVLGGCGAAVLAATFGGDEQPFVGIGLVGVSLAFGLTVLTMAYAVGHISGGHFNPAVTLGLVAGGRFSAKDAIPYIAAQVVGAIAAAAIVLLIAKGQPTGYDAAESGLASNGFDDLSPGGFNLGAAVLSEVVLTAGFLFVILGATARRAAAGFGPLAIGLALTLIHLISIPVTNTSVNPARSTGPALFAGGDYIAQLWVFWLAPILGAVVAGLVWRYLSPVDAEVDTVEEAPLGENLVDASPSTSSSAPSARRRS
jgi:aquaporin Z